MASHLLSCSLTTSGSTFSPRRPNFSNTLPPSRNSLVVTCAGGNLKDNSKFDRRDMLLGMGGLYGATNLAPAMADPIPPPDLNICLHDGATDLNNHGKVGFDCCSPVVPGSPSYPAPDYVLPSVSKMRVRPPLHRAITNNEYMEKFQRAIHAMKQLKDDDPRSFVNQSHIHCAYCNLAYPQTPPADSANLPDQVAKKPLQIHFNWLFYPWHRWYLYFYERICGELIGDPTFALPFWNWDNPCGMVIPDIFVQETTPLYDPNPLYNPNREKSHYPPATTDLHYNSNDDTPKPYDEIVEGNLSEMYSEMIQNSTTLESFYGAKYCVGSDSDQNMAGAVEGGSHSMMHWWVGQHLNNGFDMGNFSTAGNDLLFFCHHTNVDRLWNVWRHDREKQHKDKDFPDCDWHDSKFTFYDEKKNLWSVSVHDCLDHEAMGFTWEPVDNPWKRYRPAALVKRSTFAQTSKAPKRADITFPVKLDKIIRVVVDRPKKRRTTEEKEEEEELLELSGIDFEGSKFMRFQVFINDEDVSNYDELTMTAEYAGSYSHVPLSKGGRIKTKYRFVLTKLLEELDVEDDDKIVVSIVPKAGGDDVSIGDVKIVYAS